MLTNLTQKELFEILDYDPITGDFTWKINKGNQVRKDSIAGCFVEGYRYIRINGTPYKSHRLAWLFMTGRWPTNQIDHINLMKSDNRFCNLREATNSQNIFNRRIQKNNTSKLRGVYFDKRRKLWCARISKNNERISRHFKCPALASCFYAIEASKNFGDFFRLNEKR